MEKIIEFYKNDSLEEYSQIKRPNYISIGIEKEEYFLIYNETEHQITEKEVNDLLEILGSINLKVLPKYGMGCDGETYRLILSHGWNSVEFKWWSDSCGEQWKELFLFRDKITKLKEDYIK